MADVILCKVPVTEECPSGLKIVVPGTKSTIEMALKTIPNDTIRHIVMDASTIPSDRYFRDAWELNEQNKVIPNMQKSLEIHQNVLRKMRKPLLESLDAAYMEALEKNNVSKQNEIAAKKQALRDITQDPSVLNASTPEQLKSAVPPILNSML